MADGDEVTSTLEPLEIQAYLTANPPTVPTEPTGYAEMAADNVIKQAHDASKTSYDASKIAWDTSLVEIQAIIDSEV